MKYGTISISLKNRKMDADEEKNVGKMALRQRIREGLVIPSFSFPPIKTCNREVVLQDGECGCGGCYALYMRKSTMASWQRNLDAWEDNPVQVKEDLENFILEYRPKFFRFFVAGDIPDHGFLMSMVYVALCCSGTDFMFFTKQWDYVNSLYENMMANGAVHWPGNLHAVFSNGVNVRARNPYHFPESRILFPWEAVEVEKGTICGGNCYECNVSEKGCWFMEKGQTVLLPVHGAGKGKFSTSKGKQESL